MTIATELKSTTHTPGSPSPSRLVEAVDRLVEPLTKILTLMESNERRTKITVFLAAFLVVAVSAIAVYELTYAARARERLEARTNEIAEANRELRGLVNVFGEKIDANSVKIDRTADRVENQPEVKLVPAESGKPAGAVLVVKPERQSRPARAADAGGAPPMTMAEPAPPGSIEIPLQLPKATAVSTGAAGD